MRKDVLTSIDTPLLKTTLLVFSAERETDLTRLLNLKSNRHFSDWLKKEAKVREMELSDNVNGAVHYRTDNNFPYMLFIKKRKRDWEYYDTIAHEVCHLVDRYSMQYGFRDEMEFRAYLTEWLQRKIRDVLA